MAAVRLPRAYDLAGLTLEQLVQSVHELPSLPDVARRVLRMSDDPGTPTREISRIVSADLALAARLLRIANSAYYGNSRTVSTIHEAIVILGTQAVRNLALAAATYDALRKEYAGYGLRAGELWSHSMAVAIAAQIIATRTGAVPSEEAFVGGLLHDVGKIVLDVYIAPQCETIRALAELDEVPFHVAEKAVLGFDHGEVGARVAELWNLPVPLCSAILGHHDLERGADAPQAAAVIHIADVISHMPGLCLSGADADALLQPAALEILQLTSRDVEEAVVEMNVRTERASQVLSLGRAA